MSLRGRLLLSLGLVAVVLVAVAALVLRTTRDDLVAKVDDQLRAAAADQLDGRFGPGGPGVGPGGAPIAEAETGPSTLWVGRIVDGRVTVLVRPRTVRSDAAEPDLSAEAIATLVDRPGEAVTVPGSGADRFRVLAQERRAGGSFVVGATLDDVDSSVRRLAVVEVTATLLVLALLALVAFWVLRLGLRPLKRMAAAATDIAAGDLSHRVPDADPRTEAGELGQALNRMLAHIEGAFAERAASEERLRRFVADASHELRTPITTIRGYAELYRQGGLDDPADLDAALHRTEQEATRMGVLVDHLLLLARLDQGRPLEQVPVDLAALARDAVADARAVHGDHAIHLDAEGEATVAGDEHHLRQVLANLLTNAVDHTPSGTTVTVAVGPDPASVGRVRLRVADDGPGMDPGLAARAFERFARGDASRSRHTGGSGLGLSIVAAVVDAHGGAVDLASAPGAGTAVTLTFPGGAAVSKGDSSASSARTLVGGVPGHGRGAMPARRGPVRAEGTATAGGLAGDDHLARLVARALEASPDLVVVTLPAEGRVHVNAATTRLLGIDEAATPDVLGQRVPAPARQRILDEVVPAVEAKGRWEGELAVHDAEGDIVPLDITASAVRHDGNGVIEAVVVIARDMSPGAARAGQLERQATHDALTALPNRTLLLDRLDLALGRARRHASLVGVLSLDLDGFKPVNDRLGHAAGDVLLAEVARRIEAAIRPGDTAARLGGDEFVVVCEDLSSPDEATAVARRVAAAIAHPVRIEGTEVTVTASIGLALSDPEATTDAVLRRADAAMYDVKRDGRPL